MSNLQIRLELPDPLIPTSGHRLATTCLDCDTSGNKLFSGGKDGSVIKWHVSGMYPTPTDVVQNHIHWVNDVLYHESSDVAISCSSDCNVVLQRVSQPSFDSSGETSSGLDNDLEGEHALSDRILPSNVLAILSNHTDYVKRLCRPRSSFRDAHSFSSFVSAGLDGLVHVWDMSSPREPSSSFVHEQSVYAVDMASEVPVIASGSSDNVVRLWDSRADSMTCQFKGHRNVIRSVLISPDGSKVVSASSDNSIKVWDVSTQRCLQTFSFHRSSVLSMDVSSDFRTVVSGGRDGVIHVVNLDSNEAGVLTSNSKPVVFIRLSPSQSSLWAVDAEGAFSQFPFSDDLSRFSDRTFKVTSPRYVSPMKGLSASLKASMSSLPMATHPSYTVLPTKGLVKAKMLRDRRHCVCRYDDGRLVVRDVCGPSSVRDLGNPEDVKDDADLDKVCAVLSLDSQKIFSPQWCSVDTSCGCLAVTLSRSNVFACDVYAVDVGFVNVQNDDTKVNVGRALLSGVFSPSQQQQLSFSCPGNVRFVIIDVLDNQRPIYWGYVAHSPPTAVLPNWVLTALDSSKEVETENQKIAFFLEPCEGSTLASIPQSSTTRLSGPRLLRCRRIAGYVSNKLSIPEGEIVEILCDGEVIPSEMNLGSMKTFYKDRTAQGEILLRYRTRISNPQ